MPTIFEDEDFIIKKGWIWPTITIIHKASGQRKRALPQYAQRCARMIEMQRELPMTETQRQFVLSYIFYRFAQTVIEPNSMHGSMFMSGTGAGLVASAHMAARGEADQHFFEVPD